MENQEKKLVSFNFIGRTDEKDIFNTHERFPFLHFAWIFLKRSYDELNRLLMEDDFRKTILLETNGNGVVLNQHRLLNTSKVSDCSVPLTGNKSGGWFFSLTGKTPNL